MQYKHHKLGRVAYIYNPYLENKFMCEQLSTTTTYNETQLKNLGFVEQPTTDTGNDWIDNAYKFMFGMDNEEIIPSLNAKFRQALEKFMPKPVEQELIPLDVEKILAECSMCDVYKCIREDVLRLILSKYGVPKQEEKEYWTDEEIQQWMNNVRGGTEESIKYGIKTIKGFLTFHGIHKGSFKKRSEMILSTPTPQASVDVEEVAKHLFNCVREYVEDFGWKKNDIIDVFSQHLSSLPIQKKRTRDDVLEWVENHSELLEGKSEKGIINAFLQDHGLLSD